jgi:hypothetical protein
MQKEPLDLDDLLHPSRAYAHPRDVLRDPDLTLYEKRAILASWASDACAVDAAPALRRSEPAAPLVQFDEIMDALHTLDAECAREVLPRGPRDKAARHGAGAFRSKTCCSRSACHSSGGSLSRVDAMTPDRELPGQQRALIIPLSLYLRRRGREYDPFPPSPTPAAARKPPPPACVEAISAQAGADSRPAARAA